MNSPTETPLMIRLMIIKVVLETSYRLCCTFICAKNIIGGKSVQEFASSLRSFSRKELRCFPWRLGLRATAPLTVILVMYGESCQFECAQARSRRTGRKAGAAVHD